MKQDTDVNWWRFNIRPFESVNSFAARFCEMNMISTRTFFEFLPITKITPYSPLWHEALTRSANRISEDGVRFRDCLEGIGGAKIDWLQCQFSVNRELRCCEKCLAQGYHSFLHELSFFVKCPWHKTPIETLYLKGVTSKETAISACGKVMKRFSLGWPLIEKEMVDVELADKILAELRQVSKTEKKIGTSVLWESHPLPRSRYYDESMSLARPFSKVDIDIRKGTKRLIDAKLFRCTLDVQRFPIPSHWRKSSLLTTARLRAMYELFRTFLRPKTPTYAAALEVRKVADELKNMQGICNCRWQWSMTFDPCWVSVREGERPFSNRCLHMRIYDFHTTLWGVSESEQSTVLPNRDLMTSLVLLEPQATELVSTGVLLHESGAHITSILRDSRDLGYLWTQLEWNPKWPGYEIFHAMLQAEIRQFRWTYKRWLIDIDAGKNPNIAPELPSTFRVYVDKREVVIEECIDKKIAPTHVDFDILQANK